MGRKKDWKNEKSLGPEKDQLIEDDSRLAQLKDESNLGRAMAQLRHWARTKDLDKIDKETSERLQRGCYLAILILTELGLGSRNSGIRFETAEFFAKSFLSRGLPKRQPAKTEKKQKPVKVKWMKRGQAPSQE